MPTPPPTANRCGDTPFNDPSIEHAPQDGVVKLCRKALRCGRTAYRKVVAAFEEQTGTKVEVIAGPESDWTADAQADADILWGTSEQSMTAFLLTYTAFDHEKVAPIYLRSTVIAVQAGNPLDIEDFDDLLADGVRVAVTEGAGVYNTSDTGTWEDVVGRLGSLDDIAALRRNIVTYALGPGASYGFISDGDADAWITWPNWPIINDDLDMFKLAENRVIYRDVNVVLSPKADPEAQALLDVLVTSKAQKLMAIEGWRR